MTTPRLAVITGATSGIGEATAHQLAARNHDLVLIARNRAKAEKVAADITRESPSCNITIIDGDLEDLPGIRKASDEIAERFPHIDVLVNNAGVHATQSRTTAEGVDAMRSANYLGAVTLTMNLLPVLTASSGRIVNVASEAHRLGFTPTPDDIAGTRRSYRQFGATFAYGTTKYLDILFTKELARRTEGTGVTVNCVCPGLVATNISRDDPVLAALSRLFARTPFIRNPDQGAAMSVRVATEPEWGRRTGEFSPSRSAMQLLPPRRKIHDEQLAASIWDATMSLLNRLGVIPVTTTA